MKVLLLFQDFNIQDRRLGEILVTNMLTSTIILDEAFISQELAPPRLWGPTEGPLNNSTPRQICSPNW